MMRFAIGITQAYPRLRGGDPDPTACSTWGVGLSPLARGRPVGMSLKRMVVGPIPACAGETYSDTAGSLRPPAYPRLRGGDDDVRKIAMPIPGLSPLARGRHPAVDAAFNLDRPIPACAGETSPRRRPSPQGRAYPRLRGGDILEERGTRYGEGLSPLARGRL